MECKKTIGEYSVHVKVWHIDSGENYIINSSEVYYHNDKVVKREEVPTTYLRRFDRVADDCLYDYCEKLELGD